jgi:hypothetical protein
VGPSDPANGLPGRANDLAVSRTDPDAGLVARKGVPLALYHKVHVGVDGGQARIITAIDATPGEALDEHLLDRLVKEHEGTTGRTVTEVVADAKYGTYLNYRALAARGIRASIPPHLGRGKHRLVPSDEFSYDAAADRFVCPEGQVLRRQGTSCSARPGGGVIYRASPLVCGACPRKAACCGAAKARTITRPDDTGLYDRTRAYLRTAHAKLSLRRRKCWAETVMAEAKERHGLRRAQCRGQPQVRIQALGVAMAYDIKKLVRWHGRRPQAAAAALRAPRSGEPDRVAHGRRRAERGARAALPNPPPASAGHSCPPALSAGVLPGRGLRFGNRPTSSAATRSASRVFPQPPAPVSVSSRAPTRRCFTCRICSARPTKPVLWTGRLCRPVTGSPALSRRAGRLCRVAFDPSSAGVASTGATPTPVVTPCAAIHPR